MPDTSKRDAAITAVRNWHRDLVGSPDGKNDGNRAARARLRRCDTVLETVMEPSTHSLLQALHKAGLDGTLDDRACVLAAVLARVDAKSGSAATLARILGGEQQTVMSPLRFNALMQAMQRGDPGIRLRALRRAVMLAQKAGPFSVKRFAGDILFWSDETARRWAYDYWQAKLAEPDTADAAEQPDTEPASAL